MTHDPQPAPDPLIRGLNLGSATALNMIDMIGVGPFITLPLIIGAMGGPQAMLGWILGAFFALCDGLVWAELGAAMPGSGGSYAYLREIYGWNKLGRLISFLFIWQLSFSAPLSIASGAIGLAGYSAYFWPGMGRTPARLIAMGVILVAVALLYRKITGIAWITKVLWVAVMGTIGWVVVAGAGHFSAARAFSFPAGAFQLSHSFFLGLGSAMLIATYDFWGYYNVSFLGDEVRDPARTIPRAVLLSILLVACLYMLMNLSVLGVVPWQEFGHGGGLYVISTFMEHVYGPWAARLATVLVMIVAFASVFSLLLGYSRVPYAAALDGNYFKIFARVHSEGRFPYISLLALAGVAMACCLLSLADVIAALVVIRILLQFLLQAIGLIVLRVRQPDLVRPFRMWFYPAPAILASAGFIFILFARKNFVHEIRYATVILVAGLAVYMVRAWSHGEWPLASIRTGGAGMNG